MEREKQQLTESSNAQVTRIDQVFIILVLLVDSSILVRPEISDSSFSDFSSKIL